MSKGTYWTWASLPDPTDLSPRDIRGPFESPGEAMDHAKVAGATPDRAARVFDVVSSTALEAHAEDEVLSEDGEYRSQMYVVEHPEGHWPSRYEVVCYLAGETMAENIAEAAELLFCHEDDIATRALAGVAAERDAALARAESLEVCLAAVAERATRAQGQRKQDGKRWLDVMGDDAASVDWHDAAKIAEFENRVAEEQFGLIVAMVQRAVGRLGGSEQ